MNKILATSIFAVSVVLLSSAIAQSPAGGFSGPTIVTTTVKDALKQSDETAVILVGKIEKNLGNEKYIFTDATGSINVEIDNEDWNGQNITPADTVEIRGEVDKDFSKTEIDVDSIIKK